jgi:hypothetical protein
VCNFHQQFIVNDASYVELLLVLLRKGNKWSWSSTLQNPFETLRAKFADSIHLVHPYEKKGILSTLTPVERPSAECYCRRGMADITTQCPQNHGSAAEQRYSTCDQELLAIVYALDRFKIYIYGQKITLYR